MPAKPPNGAARGRLDSPRSSSPKSIQSFRREASAQVRSDASQPGRPFDMLREEARVLRREAHRVRSRSRQLRNELQALHSDYERLSGRFRLVLGNSGRYAATLPVGNTPAEVSLVASLEDERKRLARELHDDLNQQIAWLQLKLSSLEQADFIKPESYAAERRLLAEGLTRLSDKISRISHGLHPAILNDLGLEAAVRSLVADFAENENVTALFRSKAVPPDIPDFVATCFYRIAQEALRNVSKHANTQRLSVALSCAAGARLRLTVRDYGVGMPSHLNGRRGLGLTSMEERARLANGTVTIRSRRGEGTQVIVQVPLPTET